MPRAQRTKSAVHEALQRRAGQRFFTINPAAYGIPIGKMDP
jgi:hypothetical protein